MAKKKQVGRRVEGWKAKSWYKIYTPESLGKAYIGDTIAGDPESVVGRIIQTTLGEILNDYSRQNVKMKLRIANVAADAAYTEFVGHELTPVQSVSFQDDGTKGPAPYHRWCI